MAKVDELPKVQKNVDGHLGPICNNCGGYGFTLGFGTISQGCSACDQTGIARPNFTELHKTVNKLRQDVDKLTKALSNFLKDRNV